MTLPRAPVELVRNAIALLLREILHALSFRQILPDQSVGVLVGSAFPGVIRGSEVESKRERLLESTVAMELTPVVSGDRLVGLRVASVEQSHSSPDFILGARSKFVNAG